MLSKADAVNHAQKRFKDIETLRREEWKRRRLVRLEQVRQQSKDIANLVRQKVQSERDKQLGLCEERVNAKTQQWQVQKLKSLQSEYESSLKHLGKGHAEAACQPNVEALRKVEADKILAAAQKRGQEALIRLKEEEAARRKTDEERRFQLLQVRSVEEARSAAVVALPTPESTVGIKSLPSKKSMYIVAPPAKSQGSIDTKSNKSEMPVWPKKSWPVSTLPLGIMPTEQGDFSGADQHIMRRDDTAFKHGDRCRGMEQINLQQRNLSMQHNMQTSKQTSTRNTGTSALPSDVILYDYTSCYQSQYDKSSGVVEKVQEQGQINAKEAAEKEMLAQTSHLMPDTASVQREQLRSRGALQKVQVERDYKQLLGSLSVLAKQNAALQCFANATSKSGCKSRNHDEKLKVAVENLIKDSEMSFSSGLDSSFTDTPDGSMIVSRFEGTPGSIPKLNVGRWHQLTTSREKVPSPTESIVLATPPTTSQVSVSVRQDTIERNIALRSLVQRINEERQSLLLTQQQYLNEGKIKDGHNEEDSKFDVRNLEERVFHQRQQLKAQKAEVKRLDASIVVPDCMKPSYGETLDDSLSTSSKTHDSIIIEPSYSEVSQDRTPPLPVPVKMHENSFETKRNRVKSIVSVHDGKTCNSSPTKEGMMYSMDVSLSSVIMDQTESNSSGSKSLSVHGVQVLVKLCGTEEDTSGSRSMSVSLAEDVSAKVMELSSDTSGAKNEIQEKPFKSHQGSKKSLEKEQSKKPVKAKEKHISDSARVRERKSSKTSNATPLKLSKQERSIHKQEGQKRKEYPQKNNNNNAVLYHDKYMAKNEPKQKRKSIQMTQRKEAADYQEQPESSSTSYLSPPDRVLSSLTQDIKTLIALAQGNGSSLQETQTQQTQNDIHQNPLLVGYISRLLAMSRESINRLNVSCSEVSTPPSTIFHGTDNEIDGNITDLIASAVPDQVVQTQNLSVDQVDKSAHTHQSINDESHQHSLVSQAEGDHWLPPTPNDQGVLSEMTRQCHEKISALTKMIEDVRREASGNSPTNNQSNNSSYSYNQARSPQPLDSTAYMSPPPQVLEWADIVFPPQSGDSADNQMSLDPYSAAVMQLLAEVQSHLTSKGAEPLEALSTSSYKSPNDEPEKSVGYSEPWHPRSRPPVAFWKNIGRCNVTSPTEPHELSTIPELGTTLPESIGSQPTEADPDSPIHTLYSPSTPGTPPDVIAELLRRNLLTSPFSWVKKKELWSGAEDKFSLSSNSNISPKNSQESDLSSGKTGTDISASKETNTVSMLSQNSMSNGSKEWNTNVLMSPVDIYSSTDEVEVDFRRMGIGWVGAMLRKTKEAGALSSTSSSDSSPIKIDHNDCKDRKGIIDDEPILSSSVVVSAKQARGHSTPVKHPSDLSSSNRSQFA